MEGNINERRQSSAVPPPWLEPKQQPFTNSFVSGQSESTPKYDRSHFDTLDGTIPNKIQIHDRRDSRKN